MRLGDNAPSPQLRKKSQIKTIHSSLAIEHNSLSLKQVTDIIDGKRVLGAPDEIQEVKNAIEAYRLMPELDAFKEKDLLKAHGLMMKDLVKQAGHYRQEGVGVFDGNGNCLHMAPPADRVPQLMGDLFQWVKTTKEHPLIHSCVFHYELNLSIHLLMVMAVWAVSGKRCCSLAGRVSLLGFLLRPSSRNISRNTTM